MGKRGLSTPGWVLADGNSAENKGRKEHPFKFSTEDRGLDVLLPWEREDNALRAPNRILIAERASLQNYNPLVLNTIYLHFPGIKRDAYLSVSRITVFIGV